MAENYVESIPRDFTGRHVGRGGQVGIYLGKMFRMFIYQNDWKVLPMSALIAGLAGMVLRGRMFYSMEGTQAGALTLVFVCIWNGCFNSIQVICRERDVIKREHRAGMHISSYVISHMLYQAFLCMAQVVITLYVTRLTGADYSAEGIITGWILSDLAITMFLITFAADMMALWISSIVRTTTAAMTIMPFILIVQLIFSGGLFSLPEWAEPFTNYTISGIGIKTVAAQADTNNLPSFEAVYLLNRMKDDEIAEDITIGQILEIVGEDEVKEYIKMKASEAGYNPAYERTEKNIITNWMNLGLFVVIFAALTMITLEFIDKDKR